jgi:hypothetical protein
MPIINEEDWDELLDYIEDRNCTPFLGAGVSYGLFPLGGVIAENWARTHNFPFAAPYDLSRVAQFLSLNGSDKLRPKKIINRMFRARTQELLDANPPLEFSTPDSPLGVLADLPLPVYITTNYDDLMFRALRSRRKDARVELCAWNNIVQDNPGVVYAQQGDALRDAVARFGPSYFSSKHRKSGFMSTENSPVVYHLHGHYEAIDSMVLTENDYYDFLVSMSRGSKLLPSPILNALTRASLLFMGYSLADVNLRVLLRGLVHPYPENQRLSVSIQLLPGDVPQHNREAAEQYLTKYFDDLKIKVFLGTAQEFAEELWRRWKASGKK